MLDKLKRLWSRNEVAANPPPTDRTVVGETLDSETDAIRQTQMIDPSRLEPIATMSPTPQPDLSPRQKKRAKVAGKKSNTPFYRPTLRSPMAFLAVLDDGSINDAELIRLRGGPVIIGREQGEVCFPHEVLMSSRHAQLECRRHQAGYQWHFTDLASRNGSFFRVQRAVLRDGQEFLVGHHRFTFLVPNADGSFSDAAPDSKHANAESNPLRDRDPASTADVGATQLVANVDVPRPRLLYRDPKGPQRTFHLDGAAVSIGSEPKRCQLTLTDPYACPHHAQLQLGPKGWTIEDRQSQNGVWLRLREAKLDQVTEFQLGEQRFFFRPPNQPKSS